MNYQSFKGRQIDFSQPVEIYKNLHNGLFSVRQNSLVVAHVESFCLDTVSFKVSEAGRLKVIREKKKNVHAFIKGMLFDVNGINVQGDLFSRLVARQAIRYNPYQADCFFRQYEGCQSGLPSGVVIPDMYLMAHHKQGITFRIIEQ